MKHCQGIDRDQENYIRKEGHWKSILLTIIDIIIYNTFSNGGSNEILSSVGTSKVKSY